MLRKACILSVGGRGENQSGNQDRDSVRTSVEGGTCGGGFFL
jgi:hypothetical protein